MVINLLSKLYLHNRWIILFVHQDGFEPSDNCGVCIDHFEEKFIKRGNGKQLFSTIHTSNLCQSPTSLFHPCTKATDQ